MAGCRELIAFDPIHAPVVAGWASSAEDVRHWCSRAEVSAENVERWSIDSAIAAYVLVDNDSPVGYGELWIDHDESEVELARLIVPPGRRGHGVGRELVAALVAEAVRHYPMIFMRVHPDNYRALSCYRGAGFVQVDAHVAEEWNRLQPFPYVWLTYGA